MSEIHQFQQWIEANRERLENQARVVNRKEVIAHVGGSEGYHMTNRVKEEALSEVRKYQDEMSMLVSEREGALKQLIRSFTLNEYYISDEGVLNLNPKVRSFEGDEKVILPLQDHRAGLELQLEHNNPYAFGKNPAMKREKMIALSKFTFNDMLREVAQPYDDKILELCASRKKAEERIDLDRCKRSSLAYGLAKDAPFLSPDEYLLIVSAFCEDIAHHIKKDTQTFVSGGRLLPNLLELAERYRKIGKGDVSESAMRYYNRMMINQNIPHPMEVIRFKEIFANGEYSDIQRKMGEKGHKSLTKQEYNVLYRKYRILKKSKARINVITT